MKQVIYLDVLLLVNFLIAYFLLLATGLLCGQRIKFRRAVGASALAALSALVLLCPEWPFWGQLLYRVGTAALIVGAALPWRGFRSLLQGTFWYAALNILLAGVVLLVVVYTGTGQIQTGNLMIYIRVSPLLLMELSAGCCLGIELALRLFGGAGKPVESSGFEVELCDTTLRLRAVLDTGCHLKDPITCLPVLLVSYPDAKARLPLPLCAFLESWFAGQTALQPPVGISLRMIPCTTAAEHSLLPGAAVREIYLITPKGVLGLGRTAIAFTPQSFGNPQYEALYGSDFL